MKNMFKIAMPAFAILLAIGGSFGSQASQQTITPWTGYLYQNGGCSNVTVNCSLTPGTTACTVLGVQAYGKSRYGDTVCPLFLYSPYE